MGLSLLDSDESNHSSIIGNALSNLTEPSSAISMVPSEHSNDSNDSVDPNLLCEAIDTENSCVDSNQKNISSDAMLSNDTNSLSNTQHAILSHDNICDAVKNLNSEPLRVYQDNTPANLIPFNRTTFRGAIESIANTSNSIPTVMPENINNTFCHLHQQPEGSRAIRNTSMKQIIKQNPETECSNSGATKYTIVRSPLTAIGNSVSLNHDGDTMKMMISGNNMFDEFFMFQKRDPRLYTGEDNFSKLSDEVLLSIFKWLPKKALIRCSSVNRRFYRVTQDESLWTRLDLAGKTIQPHALRRILLRGVIILRMAQCKVKCRSNQSFNVTENLQHLTFFFFDFCRF